MLVLDMWLAIPLFIVYICHQTDQAPQHLHFNNYFNPKLKWHRCRNCDLILLRKCGKQNKQTKRKQQKTLIWKVYFGTGFSLF